MRGHRLLAQPLTQVPGRALGHAPGVDENQRRAVLADQRGQLLIDFLPHFVGHHRFERRRRHLDAEVARAAVAGIDDRAIERGTFGRRADQEPRHLLDRLLRRGQTDAGEPPPAQNIQAFQRQREMAAALVAGERVDLVDDDRARGRQHLAARLGAEQDVERLGRRDDDMRRPLAHPGALGLRRVAGAHEGADLDVRQTQALQFRADALDRRVRGSAGCRWTAP